MDKQMEELMEPCSQMVYINVTLHLMASVQHHFSAADAFWLAIAWKLHWFQLACRLPSQPLGPGERTRGRSWLAPCCAMEKDPKGSVTHPLSNPPYPLPSPSPSNPSPTAPASAGLKTLSSTGASSSTATIMIWKSHLLDGQDYEPAVWFVGFTLVQNSGCVLQGRESSEWNLLQHGLFFHFN